MKRKLALLLVGMLAVSNLTACGTKDETSTETNVTLAEATITPSIEVVEVDITELDQLPVEEYVTLGDYSALSVAVAPMVEATEDELNEYVQNYFYNDAKYIATEDFKTEGTLALGDVALIDYEGKKDGVAFEGGTAEDAILGIGSGNFIDGFEEGLVGVSVGETVDLNLTFPEKYTNEDLAGADVVFTVTVNGMVSLDDHGVAALGVEGYTTAEDYSNAVKFSVQYSNESEYYQRLNTAICDELLKVCEIKKIPSSIYEEQKTYVIEMVQEEAAAYGMDGDTYAQMYTGGNLADYAVTVAEAYTKQAVVFQAVANAEGVSPTQEDVDTFVKGYMEVYGIETEEEFYKNNTAEDVKIVLLQEKVIEVLKENTTITDIE